MAISFGGRARPSSTPRQPPAGHIEMAIGWQVECLKMSQFTQ